MTPFLCRVFFLALTLGGGFPLGILQAETATAPAREQQSAESSRSNQVALEKNSLIVTPEYYIGPEDVLEIIVWRNADLSKVVTVRPDGRIS